MVVRSSDSFGPFFTERSLTTGRRRASFGVGYRGTSFVNIDGRNLRDGTLVSTASVLRGDPAPFDIETVALRIRADTMTLTGNYGVSDRFDVGGAIPFVRVNLQGQRVDTYRGRELVQATGSARPRGSATSWCAPNTTCFVTAGAALRSPARPDSRPDAKRTCSAPGTRA